jgi:hypothetical protein
VNKPFLRLTNDKMTTAGQRNGRYCQVSGWIAACILLTMLHSFILPNDGGITGRRIEYLRKWKYIRSKTQKENLVVD